MIRKIHDEVWLPQPIERVFGFFSNAANLNQITPAWLDFKIITPMPVKMRPGALLEYRLKLRGLPIRWLTEITLWEPPHKFVDHQLQGPYRKWIHTHSFEEEDDGTIVRDQVEYEIFGWIVEPLIYRLFVGPDVERVFAFRRSMLKKIFHA